MKKILAIALVVFALGLIGCNSQEPEEEEVVQMPLSEAIKYIDEVARMVRYYDDLFPDVPNLFKGPNEIQGQCIDYAFLFALKTGASIIITNPNPSSEFKSGIYKVTGKSNDSSIINDIEKWNSRDINGDIRSCVEYRNGTSYFYNPKIGLYKLKKVGDYASRINSYHAWNLLGTTEIDVSNYDVNGAWRVDYKLRNL